MAWRRRPNPWLAASLFRTSPSSAGASACCSASNDSWRRACAAAADRASAPCANLHRVRLQTMRAQHAFVRDRAEREDHFQVSAARRCAHERKGRHVAISAGVGLFSGGAQRTALVIIASFSVKPSLGSARYSPSARPEFFQRAVEQVAGIIAGEGPPGAVGARCGRARGRRSSRARIRHRRTRARRR